MTDDRPDHQLTGDDPMLDQIEAATAPRVREVLGDAPAARPAPLEPGEPESALYEPDASQ